MGPGGRTSNEMSYAHDHASVLLGVPISEDSDTRSILKRAPSNNTGPKLGDIRTPSRSLNHGTIKAEDRPAFVLSHTIALWVHVILPQGITTYSIDAFDRSRAVCGRLW